VPRTIGLMPASQGCPVRKTSRSSTALLLDRDDTVCVGRGERSTFARSPPSAQRAPRGWGTRDRRVWSLRNCPGLKPDFRVGRDSGLKATSTPLQTRLAVLLRYRSRFVAGLRIAVELCSMPTLGAKCAPKMGHPDCAGLPRGKQVSPLRFASVEMTHFLWWTERGRASLDADGRGVPGSARC
jgi:hypothetical protein